MTYGSLVTQLISDYESYSLVNTQLDKMQEIKLNFNIFKLKMILQIVFFFFRGFNIGVRLIEEFLARSGITRCGDFKETAEIVAKVVFRGSFLVWV